MRVGPGPQGFRDPFYGRAALATLRARRPRSQP